MTKTNEKVECVGSLLLPTHDLQELSQPHASSPVHLGSNLRKRTTDAGSFLAKMEGQADDVEELSGVPSPLHLPSNLQKRATDAGKLLTKMEGQAEDD